MFCGIENIVKFNQRATSMCWAGGWTASSTCIQHTWNIEMPESSSPCTQQQNYHRRWAMSVVWSLVAVFKQTHQQKHCAQLATSRNDFRKVHSEDSVALVRCESQCFGTCGRLCIDRDRQAKARQEPFSSPCAIGQPLADRVADAMMSACRFLKRPRCKCN